MTNEKKIGVSLWFAKRALKLMVAGLLLFTFCNFGCASGTLWEPKSYQVQAEDVVMASYGHPGVRPCITWHEQDEMDCRRVYGADGKTIVVETVPADQADGWKYSDHCIDGRYIEASLLEGPAWIELGWHEDLKWSERKNFLHELCHMANDLEHYDGDQDHKGACFSPDGSGDPGPRMKAAQVALEAAEVNWN